MSNPNSSKERKKEKKRRHFSWPSFGSPFWVVISLTSFSRTSSSEDTLLLIIIIVVVVYCSTTLVFFKLSYYARNTRVHLDNMMMNTKGILMSEKERKEKTAKSLRDVENNNKDDEDEEDSLMKNITLNDLTKLALDSESEAAKKFGCGTTRFKTM